MSKLFSKKKEISKKQCQSIIIRKVDRDVADVNEIDEVICDEIEGKYRSCCKE